MEIERKPVGKFAKKADFVEPKKLRIDSYNEVPDNFKEGKKKGVLTLQDKQGDHVLVELNNENINTLIDLFGTETDDWRKELVVISATDEGEKQVEGVLRQCFKLDIQKG